MSYLIRNYTLCLFINLLCTLWYKGGGHNNTNTFQSFIMQVCHWLECLSHGGPLLHVTPLSLPLLPDYPFTNTGKRKNEKKKIKITIWCNVIQYGTTIYINGPWQLVVFNNDEETHTAIALTLFWSTTVTTTDTIIAVEYFIRHIVCMQTYRYSGTVQGTRQDICTVYSKSI